MNKKPLLLLIALISSFSLFSVPIASAGVMVTGSCTSTGPLAGVEDVANAASTLSQSIATLGKNVVLMQNNITFSLKKGFMALKSGQQKSDSILEKLLMELMDTQENIVREEIKAAGEIQKEETFGVLSQTLGACEATSMAASADAGEIEAKILTGYIATEIHDQQGQYETRTMAINKMYSDMTMNTSSPEVLYPVSGTYSEEDLAGAMKLTTLLIDPTPALKVPEGATPVAAAEINKNILLKNGYLATPQYVVANRLSFRAPVISTEGWSDTALISLGEELPEKISLNQYLDLEVRKRTNSPVWQDRITNTLTPGLLKEGLLMQSLELGIAKRQLDHLEALATMVAQQVSRNVRAEYNPLLNAAHKGAGTSN